MLLALTMIISCKTDEKKSYEKFIVDKNIINNDTIKLLVNFPELKLFESEIVESKARTAYLVQTVSGYNLETKFDNYKSNVTIESDTLNISLNNSNGYFGNGILIKVFDGQFFVKDVDPKTLKGEDKFLSAKPILQKLILNNDQFNKKDSIYGAIYYHAIIEDHIDKEFKGYFRTKIK